MINLNLFSQLILSILKYKYYKKIMSKKNFLSKLKDATKSVPFNVNLNDIKKNAAEKVNSIYQ